MFLDAGEACAQAAVLSWEDICCAVRVGGAAQLRQILTDVSGIAGAPDTSGTNAGSRAPNSTNGSSHGSGNGGVGAAPSNGGSGPAGSGSDGIPGRQKRGSGGTAGGGMCAILGPSGAGKTTLLDILAGRRYGAGAILAVA